MTSLINRVRGKTDRQRERRQKKESEREREREREREKKERERGQTLILYVFSLFSSLVTDVTAMRLSPRPTMTVISDSCKSVSLILSSHESLGREVREM